MIKYSYYTGKENRKKLKKFFGLFSIILGIALFVYFLLPAFFWQFYLSQVFASNSLESPVPKYFYQKNSISFKDFLNEGVNFLTNNYDDARNWYPNLKGDVGNFLPAYKLSIPKLGINNALVSTADYDLSSHLVQYLGTSLPGQNGTAVIFGHSTLPSLFNPKNYTAIFATLHTLRLGDEIKIDVNGVIFKYRVITIEIKEASDTNIFSQSYDDSYITLVTCTPPGTTWKRLVVRAKLTT